jgi:hypothetical protein
MRHPDWTDSGIRQTLARLLADGRAPCPNGHPDVTFIPGNRDFHNGRLIDHGILGCVACTKPAVEFRRITATDGQISLEFNR